MKKITNCRILGAVFCAGVVFCFSSAAFAQAKSGDNDSGEKFYDFSGDDIDGDLVRPDGDLVDPAKFVEHTSLIKVRTDFIKEIIKSAEDL